MGLGKHIPGERKGPAATDGRIREDRQPVSTDPRSPDAVHQRVHDPGRRRRGPRGPRRPLERVASCMPGATLEEVDGATYSGRMKVKIGPLTLTYAGTATLTEQDPDARTARIEASGREKRGGGTASADVHASMVEVDDGTRVLVTTDINVTGKPAQFGRGVMADVGAKIIDRFADNLRDELSADGSGKASTGEVSLDEGTAETPAGVDPSTTAADAPATTPSEPSINGEADASPGPRRVEHRPPKDEALYLIDVAGEATANRLVPVLVAVIAVLLVVIWYRLRRVGTRSADGPR